VYGLPNAQTAAGDLQSFFATATSADQSGHRYVVRSNRSLANRTLTFGSALTPPTISTLATAPYLRLRASGTWNADYGSAIDITYRQTNRSWSVQASRGYTGAAAAYQLDIPDLSGVTGFQATWGLLPATPTPWTLTMWDTIMSGFGGTVEDAIIRFADRSGTYNP
jgi:hypothetical protein